jgi:hypothetical protein
MIPLRIVLSAVIASSLFIGGVSTAHAYVTPGEFIQSGGGSAPDDDVPLPSIDPPVDDPTPASNVPDPTRHTPGRAGIQGKPDPGPPAGMIRQGRRLVPEPLPVAPPVVIQLSSAEQRMQDRLARGIPEPTHTAAPEPQPVEHQAALPASGPASTMALLMSAVFSLGIFTRKRSLLS